MHGCGAMAAVIGLLLTCGARGGADMPTGASSQPGIDGPDTKATVGITVNETQVVGR